MCVCVCVYVLQYQSLIKEKENLGSPFFLMVTKKTSGPPRRGHRVHTETETAKADPRPKVGSIAKKRRVARGWSGGWGSRGGVWSPTKGVRTRSGESREERA